MIISRFAPSLARDRRAIASLEFVIVAPVLLSLAVGMAEAVRYVRSRAQLYYAATAMADMVAAQRTVTSGLAGSLADICRGAQYTLAPLPISSLAMTVASYTYPIGTGNRVKDWEVNTACPTTGTGAASTVATDTTNMTPTRGDSVIAVSASYTYTPMVNAALPAVTFTQVAYSRPRFGAVLCPGC